MNTIPSQPTEYDIPIDTVLSPPPPILHPDLRAAVRTHSSASGLPRNKDLDADGEGYEKLAHVGDSLISVAVVLVSQRKFPLLRKDSATKMKAAIVSNYTLAQLAEAYDLGTLMVAHPAQLPLLQTDKCLGSLFEAHVAGVYYDYFQREVPGIVGGVGYGPNDCLPPLDQRTEAEAFGRLLLWLDPLFAPLITDFHDKRLSVDLHDKIDTADDDKIVDDKAAHGALAQLNEVMIQKTGAPPQYTHFSTVEGWGCTCVATVGANVYTASAVRDTKKAAKSIAPYKVVQQMGLQKAGVRARYLRAA